MPYAKRVLKPLNQVAIVDQATIDAIVAEIPPSGLTISEIKADLDIADAITKKHSSGSDNQDLSNLVVKETGKSLVADSSIASIHASGSDNQDLSDLVTKITGKGLSTEDYTTTEKNKLTGIAESANNYTHPANHSPAVITQDISNRFVTDTEKATWNAAHSWKAGIATKNITDASIVQNIAHGLGRIPKFVRIDGAVIITAAITQMCTGVYDGTNNNGLSVCIGEGTSTAATDAVYTSTSIAMGFSPLVATNPFTGANRQTGIITVDATNIIITWTKTGTVGSLTASLLWQAN